jgi:hypothetical protein
MGENGGPLEPPDLRCIDENRNRYPFEQLTPFEGQHVAWRLDGKRILASGEDRETVEKKLVAAGIDPSQVVFDYIDPPERESIGRALL